MKASDLRIGNWVRPSKEHWTYRESVNDFQWDESDWYGLGECTMSLEAINPIPLTEEWLLKLVFINFKNESELYQCGFLSIDKDKDEFYYQAIKNHYQERAIRIDYVHQLQNLYFALTNEELTINESKEAND